MENRTGGIIADLHIHSRFSRACSKNIDLINLEKWARIRGIDILGTSDFTHPEWLNELKSNLTEKKGILYSKTGFRFVLSGELSFVFSQGGKGRRVHLLILAPNFEAVDSINSYLDKKGRRDYDGRPIFNISCENFVKDMKEISDKIEIIPAHIWTPWFGVLGSKSGFDSLKEAFGSQADKIYAIETGISSTPQMNFKISEIQKKTIMSFSDSHSFWPWRLGREATIFSKADSYDDIINEIRQNKIIGTIETNPAYGIYHYDGHKDCNFSCSPAETKKLNKICPICKKPLTIGVEYRVEELADSDEQPKKIVYEILPLHEIIALSINSSLSSKKTWDIYNNLINEFKTEFNILLDAEKDKIAKASDSKLAELIIINRKGKIKVKPGYDGEYGKAILEESQKKLI